MFCTTRKIPLHNVARYWQYVKLFLRLAFLLFFEGLNHFHQELCNSSCGWYLTHGGHCMFVETSPNSNTSLFPKLWTIFLDSSLNMLNSPVFLWSVITDFLRDWVLSVCTKFWIFVIRPWSSSTALCGAPCTRQSILKVSPSAHASSMLDCCCTSLSCCTCQAFNNTLWGWGDIQIYLMQSLVLSCTHLFSNVTSMYWVIKDESVRSGLPEL